MKDTFTLSHNQFIDLLGGTKKVAKMAKVSQAAVTHWRTSDIPEGQLIRLAAELTKSSKKQNVKDTPLPFGMYI